MAIVDLRSIPRLLRSCNAPSHLLCGRQLHLHLLKSGLASSLFFANSLLGMYGRCCASLDARQLFYEMPQRNPFSWNSLLDAYIKSGDPATALHLFNSMPEKNSYSWNSIIAGLVRHGDLNSARNLFDEMPMKDPVACNALVHGYVRNGCAQEAFGLYKKMRVDPAEMSLLRNDNFILATLVSACADVAAHDFGKQIHARIVINNVGLDSVLGSALVDMYGKCEDFDSAYQVVDLMSEVDEFSLSAMISGYASCGRLIDARSLFDSRNSRGIVLWNSMINGYVSNDQGEEALSLFKGMRAEGVQGDASTFTSVFGASTISGMLENGTQTHASAIKLGFLDDIVVASALIDTYSKFGLCEDACRVFSELRVHDTVLLNSMIYVHSNCGRVTDARMLFESILERSLISWNSMIMGYSQNGCPVETLGLFCEMRRLGLSPDKVTLASVISACACISSLGLGEQIFGLATIIGLESDEIICTSLIDLYCKCGSVSDGRKLFDGIVKSDKAPWNSMLLGYASNGYGIEVLKLFEAMRDDGVAPNEVTFIGVLSGCCHCGLVEEGLRLFDAMKVGYGIEPIFEHYSCIVDLLVRAGLLEEAIDIIDRMPFEADAGMWTSVLGGCKAREDEFLGRKVSERLVDLSPQQSGPYVQLSSLHAAHGEWERSTQVRLMMKERKIKKNPGFSWIDNWTGNLVANR